MAQRIFIADPNEDWLEEITVHLQKTGYEVLSAENEKDAKDVLNINSVPRVIVLDSRLAADDDLALLKYIRTDTRIKSIPILIMRGAGDKEDTFRQQGVKEFIAKPIVTAELSKKMLLIIKFGSTTPPKKSKKLSPTAIALIVIGLAVVFLIIIIVGVGK